MQPHSILVGKTYRTAGGERRQVTALANGIVTFEAVPDPSGPGTTGHSTPREMPLVRFAAEVESEQELD